jgi:hypothetical protein
MTVSNDTSMELQVLYTIPVMPRYAIPIAHASAPTLSQPRKRSKSITQRRMFRIMLADAVCTHSLNNNQLLNRVVPLAALHPGPNSVCQRAADGPHDRDGGLECACNVLATRH